MSKILAALIAAAFSFGVYAQAPKKDEAKKEEKKAEAKKEEKKAEAKKDEKKK